MKEIAIIVSGTDPAGLNIKEKLLSEFGFVQTELKFDESPVFELTNFNHLFKLYTLKSYQVFADSTDAIPADFLAFASKHVSAKGVPSLTCHALGNFGSAELGGRPGTLYPTSALLLARFLQGLNTQKTALNLPFEVTLEATHHGPHLTKPSVFIELGSSQEGWENPLGGLAVTQTIIAGFAPDTERIAPEIAIGLGGTHYCNAFNKLVLEGEYAFSHICPKYALGHVNSSLLAQMIRANLEPVTTIVLDYKGLGSEKERILELAKKTGLKVVRV